MSLGATHVWCEQPARCRDAPATVAGVHDVESLVRQEALTIRRLMKSTGIWPPMPENFAQPEPKPPHLVTRLALDSNRCNNSTHLEYSQQRDSL